MIQAHRITVGWDLTFERISILEADDKTKYPNFFEDSNFVFSAPDGIRSLPYYNITIIELDKVCRTVQEGVKVTRISVGGALSYGPATIIPSQYYAKYGIPVVLPLSDQFVFSTKEGTYITSDYNINCVHLARS